MPGAVWNVFDEGIRLVKGLEDEAGDAEVGVFTLCPKVINATRLAFFKNGEESGGTIIDVDPIADLLSRPVEREGKIAQRVVDEFGDELFRVLAGAVVVGATCDDHVLAVGGLGREGEEIGARFAGGIG